jgi:ABC-type lipoprotein release transport system permease subunit
MKVPISYSYRNLLTRKLTTILTVSGMGLVVFVFSAVLMLAEGLEKTLVQSGSFDNVVVIRKAAESEVQSGIDKLQADIVEMLPQISVDSDGERFFAKELVVLITLPKKFTDKTSSVTIRGIGTKSMLVRSSVRLVKGRMLRTGTSEIIVGVSVAKRFKDLEIGKTLRFGMRDWNIVGLFDAGNTSFSSEIWADVNQLMQTFRRNVYSSLIFKLRDPYEFEMVKGIIENDPRLTLEAMRETKYYEKQSSVMAKFLRILGISLTSVFSLGAIIGAMITMYSAVANRISEIGTMRALGFTRMNILIAFLIESLFLGLCGGIVGLFFASFLQLYTVSTLNFQTFSELAFTFSLNLKTILLGMGFSLVMGFLGGLFPAYRASRMNIVDALRTG